MTEKDAENNNDPLAIVAPTGLEFKITDSKLYVPVVTLLKESDIKPLEQLKAVYKKLKNGINTDHKWPLNLEILT